MKRLCLLLFCSLSIVVASAETLVRGKVKDAAKGSGVAYATVSASRGSSIVAAVAADASGNFELRLKEDGDYSVELSAVGYQTLVRSVSALGKPIELGEVLLSEGVAVDAVAVTVQKPIVTADAEKLSYSVEDDPEAQSSTLEEIIRKIPQLSIDAEGKVLMNGQSDYKILVNGRAAGAMGRNFNDIIKSMPASSIKKIEVITNPSMKYDAEGAGGVLNIITSKTRFDGYNGNVSLAAGSMLNRNYFGQLSSNFTVQKDKFSLSGGLYMGGSDNDNDPTGYHDVTMENLNADAPYSKLKQFSEQGWGGKNLYANLSMGYQIDTLNLLTVEASCWFGNWNSKRVNSTSYLGAEDNLLSSYTANEFSQNRWKGVDLLAAYEHTFAGKEGHSLTMSEYFSVTPPTENINNEDTFYPDGTSFLYSTTSLNKGFENVLQADYNNKWGDHSLEAGLKHTIDHSSLAQQGTTSQAAATTTLTKNIAALYAGYAYSHKSLTARAGARLEGAWYNSQSVSDKTENYKSALVNVVPYLSLSYKIKEGHNLSLSYSERLSRPGIQSLSPYVTETSLSRSYGNPDLKTGVNHSVRLKYAWMNNKWTVSPELMTMFSNNRVAVYQFVDKEGLINQTWLNHGRNRAYALQTSLSYRPSQKLQLAADLRVGYFEDGIPSQNVAVAGWAFSESVNVTVALWKGARLTLSEYCAKMQPQQTMVAQNWFLTTSARLGQKLLKDRLELSLSVQNPHSKTMKHDLLMTSPTYVQNLIATNITRSIRFSISYRFGKQGLYVKRANRKADSTTEEVGASNQQGGNM
ncbi:MAG: TonB-dependent receptor [Alistipes sp.]|nr:TonB-dependent receptor [Alistipes sp.]